MSGSGFSNLTTAGLAEVSPFSAPDVKHLWRRFWAFTLDSLILGFGGWMLINAVVRPTSPVIQGPTGSPVISFDQLMITLAVALGINAALVVGYFASLEWAFGCSVGKAVFDLRVVDFAGADISFAQALIRNLMRIIDGIPATLYGIGWIVAMSSERRQRWGDKGAGTLVVARSALSAHRREAAAQNSTAPSFLALRQI